MPFCLEVILIFGKGKLEEQCLNKGVNFNVASWWNWIEVKCLLFSRFTEMAVVFHFSLWTTNGFRLVSIQELLSGWLQLKNSCDHDKKINYISFPYPNRNMFSPLRTCYKNYITPPPPQTTKLDGMLLNLQPSRFCCHLISRCLTLLLTIFKLFTMIFYSEGEYMVE